MLCVTANTMFAKNRMTALRTLGLVFLLAFPPTSILLRAFAHGYGGFELFAIIVLAMGVQVAIPVAVFMPWAFITVITCTLRQEPLRNGLLKAGILLSFLMTLLTVTYRVSIYESSCRAGARMRIGHLGGNSFLEALHQDAQELAAISPGEDVSRYYDTPMLPRTFQALGAGHAVVVRSPRARSVILIVRPGHLQSEWIIVSCAGMDKEPPRGVRVYDNLYRL